MNTLGTTTNPSGSRPFAAHKDPVAADARQKRFLKNLLGGDPTGIEWGLGALKIGLGAWMILPTHLFESSHHLYRYAEVVPAWVWGTFFLPCGVVSLVAWWYQWQRARFFGTMVSVFFWVSFGSCLWAADHRSAALVWLYTMAAIQFLAGVWLFGKAFPLEGDRSHGHDRH